MGGGIKKKKLGVRTYTYISSNNKHFLQKSERKIIKIWAC